MVWAATKEKTSPLETNAGKSFFLLYWRSPGILYWQSVEDEVSVSVLGVAQGSGFALPRAFPLPSGVVLSRGCRLALYIKCKVKDNRHEERPTRRKRKGTG